MALPQWFARILFRFAWPKPPKSSWLKYEKESFVIWGAEGDRDFFSEDISCVATHRPWFHGRLPSCRDKDVYLLEGRGGKHDHELIAITSRTMIPIPDRLAGRGSASVVVHRFRNAEKIEQWRDAVSDSLGTAILELADTHAKRVLREEVTQQRSVES